MFDGSLFRHFGRDLLLLLLAAFLAGVALVWAAGVTCRACWPARADQLKPLINWKKNGDWRQWTLTHRPSYGTTRCELTLTDRAARPALAVTVAVTGDGDEVSLAVEQALRRWWSGDFDPVIFEK